MHSKRTTAVRTPIITLHELIFSRGQRNQILNDTSYGKSRKCYVILSNVYFKLLCDASAITYTVSIPASRISSPPRHKGTKKIKALKSFVTSCRRDGYYLSFLRRTRCRGLFHCAFLHILRISALLKMSASMSTPKIQFTFLM